MMSLLKVMICCCSCKNSRMFFLQRKSLGNLGTAHMQIRSEIEVTQRKYMTRMTSQFTPKVMI